MNRTNYNKISKIEREKTGEYSRCEGNKQTTKFKCYINIQAELNIKWSFYCTNTYRERLKMLYKTLMKKDMNSERQFHIGQRLECCHILF